jgi:pseudolysin
MDLIQKRVFDLPRLLFLSLPLVVSSIPVYAAKTINLRHESISNIQSLITQSVDAAGGVKLEETGRSVDFNNTLHIFVKETYQGHAVWGSDAAIHISKADKKNDSLSAVINPEMASNTTMNGTIFNDLKTDLATTSARVLTNTQAQLALDKAISDFKRTVKTEKITYPKSELIIYIDEKKENKARYAFKVSFNAEDAAASHQSYQPITIMDASTLEVLRTWDNIQTVEPTTVNVLGGGYGGNVKMGKLAYDNLSGHLPQLNIQRDASKKTCYWQNDDVLIKKYEFFSWDNVPMSFPCNTVDSSHNNVYWVAERDAVNGGYGPASDALFAGSVIKDMYEKWYHSSVLPKKSGEPLIAMVVHKPYYDNAEWDGRVMTFGDGWTTFYPLTSLGVAAHEFSHAFTQYHSGLVYSDQSGGINESFSDMAAQAAEFYAYGKNSWEIGAEIFKEDGKALRYMNQPSKDCEQKSFFNPWAQCSIDNASQYYQGLDVHFSSGVYNRLFYLMATAPNWNVKKAFDVMVQANQNRYWTSMSDFQDAACGVLKATKDYGYSIDDVKKAIEQVRIDVSHC